MPGEGSKMQCSTHSGDNSALISGELGTNALGIVVTVDCGMGRKRPLDIA
jgi:hypothetical protein